jgi:E3 ubiquitin-protein ligase RNF115/126
MKRVDIPNNLGYIPSHTKQYWCHLCQREFSRLYIENSEVHCRTCGKTFCEEINNREQTDHPSNYQPFEQRSTQRRQSGGGIRSIFDALSSLMSFNEEAHMENIINFLMANDPNKYGNPPASKDEVEKLEKIKVDTSNLNILCKNAGENSCSICQDDYEIDNNLIKLPCNHYFHDDCIMPWLKERNSCPTCRFELKTDDKDYEDRKNEKRNQVRQTTQNNSGNSNTENVDNNINNDTSNSTSNNLNI